MVRDKVTGMVFVPVLFGGMSKGMEFMVPE